VDTTIVPPHPTVHGHPAPLVTRWITPDEDAWNAGPWKSLVATARAGHWDTTMFFARGWMRDSRGNPGALTDTISLRCRRDRNEIGDVDRAVAIWSHATWPVLGRDKRDEDTTRTGEGEKTNEGKTWQWHPPMPLPEAGVPAAPWKFFAAWIWTEGAPVHSVKAMQLRAWLKAVPALVESPEARAA
jgi:hypothetical protein